MGGGIVGGHGGVDPRAGERSAAAAAAAAGGVRYGLEAPRWVNGALGWPTGRGRDRAGARVAAEEDTRGRLEAGRGGRGGARAPERRAAPADGRRAGRLPGRGAGGAAAGTRRQQVPRPARPEGQEALCSRRPRRVSGRLRPATPPVTPTSPFVVGTEVSRGARRPSRRCGRPR